ncbi:lantibiotic ABC transporter [marine bacterium AO1-C]|nr:lantibiotic ABC transporter [marine bacterium AO1-C]
MIIENFPALIGKHCETTATGSLLNQIGIELSEPMLFGLGEGLGFIFWNMKAMDFPFIGGRVKTDALTENICRNLHLQLEVKETASAKKAWQNVAQYIDQGKAVGLKLDCYHLEYFTNKIHFAGHYVAMYGYDEQKAYLIDSNRNRLPLTTSLESLALARSEKGPMASKNLSYTINRGTQAYDLKQAVKTAIVNNAQAHLNPPIQNMGYKGILKTAAEIKKWFKRSSNITHEFTTTAMIMEKAGTGGALFRNIYRDFLGEAYDLLQIDEIKAAQQSFQSIAQHWTAIAHLLEQAGSNEDETCIQEAAELLTQVSEKEQMTMDRLLQALL